MLYLLALQEQNKAPFRVVDEINQVPFAQWFSFLYFVLYKGFLHVQGMDEINERKVFAEIMVAATKPTTPQCFLISKDMMEIPSNPELIEHLGAAFLFTYLIPLYHFVPSAMRACATGVPTDVHIVFNGKHNIDQQMWNTSQLVDMQSPR